MGPPTPLPDPEQHEPRKDSIPAEPFGQTSTPGLHQGQGSGRVSCYCSLLGRLWHRSSHVRLRKFPPQIQGGETSSKSSREPIFTPNTASHSWATYLWDPFCPTPQRAPWATSGINKCSCWLLQKRDAYPHCFSHAAFNGSERQPSATTAVSTLHIHKNSSCTGAVRRRRRVFNTELVRRLWTNHGTRSRFTGLALWENQNHNTELLSKTGRKGPAAKWISKI